MSELTEWLLVDGDRLTIAGGIVAFTAVVLLAIVGAFGADALQPKSPIYFLFSSMLGGVVTLITIVLSINQLVLSRELGTPGSLNQRIEGSLEYRSDVEGTIDRSAAPVETDEFLHTIHDALGDQTETLRRSMPSSDADRRESEESLAASLEGDVERVTDALEDDRTSTFEALVATLRTNHARQLLRVSELRAEYGDRLEGRERESIDAIGDLLEQIDVARRYYRTIYVQKELARLSRVLLYVGVPAVFVAGTALVLYNVAVVRTFPSVWYAAIVVGTFALCFAPLAVLFAFIVRLAWMAQQMATVMPFVTDE